MEFSPLPCIRDQIERIRCPPSPLYLAVGAQSSSRSTSSPDLFTNVRGPEGQKGCIWTVDKIKNIVDGEQNKKERKKGGRVWVG